jgi:ribonucleoside-diphosphate reductase alpha chain
MEEWLSLYKSKSGERGVFNRQAAQKTVAKLGERRDATYEFGTNPCSEIILRDKEFCNLSEVIVRPDDTADTLKRKVRLAAILGTWQASLTHFPYLSSDWRKNCEEEALLGVSLTGILDNKMMRTQGTELDSLLSCLRETTVEANKEWAKRIGINPAAAITCVKPSGTVSQLTDSASGIHARHSEYYIRTVRADRKDPLCQFMIEQGFPAEPCVMRPDHTMVFSFPMKAVGSVTRNDMTAIEHLELWLTYQRHWCEHKPSITVTVREGEWMEVGAWVYAHFDEISGISFLPHSDHTYQQAPYQDCTAEQYEAALKTIPQNVDWSGLIKFEKEDSTKGTQTYACSGDKCEVVDLTT